MFNKKLSGPAWLNVWLSLALSGVASCMGVARAWAPKIFIGAALAAAGGAAGWGIYAFLPWMGSWVAKPPVVAMIDTKLATPTQWQVFLTQYASIFSVSNNASCLKDARRQAGPSGMVWLDDQCATNAFYAATALRWQYVQSRVDEAGFTQQEQALKRAKPPTPKEVEARSDEKLGLLLARRLRQGGGVEAATAAAMEDLRHEMKKEEAVQRQRREDWQKRWDLVQEQRRQAHEEDRARQKKLAPREDAAQAVLNALSSHRLVEIDRPTLCKALTPWALAAKNAPTASLQAAAQSEKVVDRMRKTAFWMLAFMAAAAAGAFFAAPHIKKWGSQVAQKRRNLLRPQWESQQMGQDIKAGKPQKTRMRL